MTRPDEPLPDWIIEEIKQNKEASGPHITIDELDHYLEDQVPSERQAEIREHLIWCRTCFERTRILSEPNLSLDSEAAKPAEKRRFFNIDPRLFLVAALFLLSFTLWRFLKPERPATGVGFELIPFYQTRGDEPNLIDLSGSWLVLSLNGIPLGASKPFQAKLFRQVGGTLVFEKQLADPGAGSVYHLLIPPHYLERGEIYRLEIHSPDQESSPVTTYVFETEP